MPQHPPRDQWRIVLAPRSCWSASPLWFSHTVSSPVLRDCRAMGQALGVYERTACTLRVCAMKVLVAVIIFARIVFCLYLYIVSRLFLYSQLYYFTFSYNLQSVYFDAFTWFAYVISFSYYSFQCFFFLLYFSYFSITLTWFPKVSKQASLTHLQIDIWVILRFIYTWLSSCLHRLYDNMNEYLDQCMKTYTDV